VEKKFVLQKPLFKLVRTAITERGMQSATIVPTFQIGKEFRAGDLVRWEVVIAHSVLRVPIQLSIRALSYGSATRLIETVMPKVCRSC
jgi:hypothetical protein